MKAATGKIYPYLPGYLLAACEALEEEEKKLPAFNISEESMNQIKKEVATVFSDLMHLQRSSKE